MGKTVLFTGPLSTSSHNHPVADSRPRMVVPSLGLLCLALAFLACRARPSAGGAGPLPWQVGDTAAGWKIVTISHVPKIVRLGCLRAGERSAVEIIAWRPDSRLPYRTRLYTVQPVLGANPPAPLLRAVYERVLEWENTPGHRPFVIPEKRSVRERRPDRFFFFGQIALFFLFLFVLWDWTNLEPAWRNRVGACLCAVAALTGFFFVVLDPNDIPIDWVTPLYAGRSETDLRQIYARGAHAGPNFMFVSKLWAWGQYLQLRDVVRMNLWLSAVNACFFMLIGWRVLRRFLPALCLTIVFVGNRSSLSASFSGSPGELLALYFFMGIVAGAVLKERAAARSGRAMAALALLAALSLLAFWTRKEVAGIGIVALLAAVFSLISSSAGRQEDGIASRMRGIVSWSPWKKLSLLALVTAFSLDIWIVPGPWGWLVDGLRPANPSFFLLPVVLQNSLPVGMVLLFVLGAAHALRRPLRFLCLPVALILMFRIYHSAAAGSSSHIFRFATFLTPAVFFLALFGWREMESRLANRGLGRSVRKAAAWALALLFLVPPFGAADGFYKIGPKDESAREGWLLNGNNQIEVRYLLRALERHPECILVSKTLEIGDRGGGTEYRWAFFGKALSYVRFVRRDRRSLDEMLRSQYWLPSCVLFFHGLDCNVEKAEGCREETRGRRLVDSLRFRNRHPDDSAKHGGGGRGGYPPAIRLSLYDTAGAATGDPGASGPF